MRVALLHDYLNQYGGAERVLETFCEIFPDAPIYTLFYDEKKTLGRFKDKKIVTSFLNNKFVCDHHRPFIPFMPIAASLMSVNDDYDIVLSSSAGFGKGIGAKKALHISYCHTPLRYAWEHYKYFNWGKTLKSLSSPAFWYLKTWDKMASRKTHKFIANSKYIANKISDYYQKNSKIIYPPVDTEKFNIISSAKKKREIASSLIAKYPASLILQNNFKILTEKNIKEHGKGNYFVAVGRLVHYKKFDLVIQTFNKLNLPLLVVGEGPELNKLKKMARSPKIEFLEFVSDEQLNFIYNYAQALIFPQIEDFGLVAAEAQACGTPVVALNQGGGKEIIVEGKTGILFDHQSVEDLIMAIRKVQLGQFDRKLIRKHALRFSKKKFKKAILKAVYAARDGK
ncbi:MAG: glycosyltransferase [Patescibacteria group bacterium]|nr:glycosyltransferase [Patescibacteria group bacterium]